MDIVSSTQLPRQDHKSDTVMIEGIKTKNRSKKDFTIISNEILRDPSLSKGAKLALIMLLSYCWFGKNNCFPGQERLAKDLSKSARTVRRYLTELQEKEYLKVTRRGLGKTNHYTLRLSANGTKLTASERTNMSCPERTKVTGESDESKLTQAESYENSSKELGGMVEAIQSQTEQQIAHETTGNTKENTGEKTGEKKAASNINTVPNHDTNPSQPNQAGTTNIEPPQTRERPARRPLASNAEVIGKGSSTQRHKEKPRMTAPPLTQDDMDQRIRERRERERATAASEAAKQENPLPGIIADSHWQNLNDRYGAATTACRSKRQPVYEKLQLAIERISEELGDFKHVHSNITQAENIRREAHADIEQFIIMLYEARAATKHAVTCGKLQKQDSTGKLVKMPYFYAVLREKAGIAKSR